MDLEHSFTVPVPRDQAWNVLLDVERVAPCMPGATLDSVDGDVITGRIKVKVGPIAMTYAGTARFTERDEAGGVVVLAASGKETRGAGTASASVRSVLENRGDQTHVTVYTTLNVTGRPAQFGRGVMAEVGGKLIGIFAGNLADMLAAGAAGQPEGHQQAARQAARQQAAQPGADVPVEDLHLPTRSYNSLRREGIHTLGALTSRTSEQLLAIENIGPASVEEIRQKLAERGLSLSDSAARGNGARDAGGDAPAAPGGGPAVHVVAAPGGTASGGTASGTGGAAPAAQPLRPAPQWEPPSGDDDAIDLLSVAGLPVLKRALPIAAALVAAALIALRIRYRRSKSRS